MGPTHSRSSEYIMQKWLVVVLIVVFSFGICLSQSTDQSSSQSSGVDCTDPVMAATPACNSAQNQRSNSTQGRENAPAPLRTPVLTNPAGISPDQYNPAPPPVNPSEMQRSQI